MKHALVYRVAACLLFLFFAGHSVGSFSGRAPTADAAPVLAAMKTVHFDFHGSTRTFYEIFFAYGVIVAMFLLSSAVVAWRLAAIDPRRSPDAELLAWCLFAVGLGTAGLAWNYFFVGPAVITTLATACLGVGALRMSRLVRLDRGRD